MRRAARLTAPLAVLLLAGIASAALANKRWTKWCWWK